MASCDIPGTKSLVHISPERGLVVKRYVNPPLTLGDHPALAEPASLEPPEHRFYVESGVLRALSGEPCAPRFMGADEPTLTVTMEYLSAPSRRDELVAKMDKSKDLYRILLRDIAVDVAVIHNAFARRDAEIMGETRGKSYGLRVRLRSEMEEKVWGYVRTIVTATAPELAELRKTTNRDLAEARRYLRETFGEHQDTDAAQKSIKEKASEIAQNVDTKVRDFLSGKGVEPERFVNDYVRRYFLIMYGTDDPEKQGESLYRRGALRIIHGDLGPHHLRKDRKAQERRTYDFDEVRLGPAEVDLSAALYNIFTYPKTPADESRLFGAALVYFRATRKNKSGKRKRGFAARLTAARLDEMVRLFGVDCRVPTATLRAFTHGHPAYKDVPNAEFRQRFLNDVFINGMQTALTYWTAGEGWDVLKGRSGTVSDAADALRQNLVDVNALFLKARVFDGVGDNAVMSGLEALVQPE